MGMGGSERLVYNLAQRVDRDIFSPSIAWFFGDKNLEDFEKLGIPLIHVPKTKRFDINAFRSIGEIIKKNNIHVVNAHHFMPMVYSFYGCKIANSIKLIYTEHSTWEIEKISWKWRKIGHHLLNRIDAVVGISEAVSKEIQDKLRTDSKKIFTIQNGADIEAFDGAKGKKYQSDLRKTLGIADNEKTIGIVANLKRIKNHIFLLHAFRELVQLRKDVKLLLIGQGFKEDKDENTEQEIKNFINEHGLNNNVLLLGYRSDIYDLLNIMDIFCLTSYKEGLPVSLIEAMAAGLPVVGTDVEGIRDVIVQDKNGFLVKLGDIPGLRNILYKLLNDEGLMNRLSEESRTMAKEKYSLNRCVSEYQDLFLQFI